MLRILVPVALTLAAGIALADQPAPPHTKQTPPAAGPPRQFAIPAHQDVVLDNGARVTTVAYGSVAKTAVQLFIRGGRSDESAAQTWLAELTGSSLAEGTRTRPAAKLAEEAAAMGGDLEIEVQLDQMVISIEVLAEFAPRAIALIADVARNPAFPAPDVARVQSDLVRRLAISRTEPGALASEQFAGALFPDHAYGRTLPSEDRKSVV